MIPPSSPSTLTTRAPHPALQLQDYFNTRAITTRTYTYSAIVLQTWSRKATSPFV